MLNVTCELNYLSYDAHQEHYEHFPGEFSTSIDFVNTENELLSPILENIDPVALNGFEVIPTRSKEESQSLIDYLIY